MVSTSVFSPLPLYNLSGEVRLLPRNNLAVEVRPSLLFIFFECELTAFMYRICPDACFVDDFSTVKKTCHCYACAEGRPSREREFQRFPSSARRKV